MTREELNAEVVAEVRGILARLKEMSEQSFRVAANRIRESTDPAGPLATFTDSTGRSAPVTAEQILEGARQMQALRDAQEAGSRVSVDDIRANLGLPVVANEDGTSGWNHDASNIRDSMRRARDRDRALQIEEEARAGRTIVIPETTSAPPRLDALRRMARQTQETIAAARESIAAEQPDADMGPQEYIPHEDEPPQYIGAEMTDAGVQFIPRPVEIMIRRLLALLGLSPGEREFVQSIADTATTQGPAEAFPLIEIYADWLEDAGRVSDSVRVRRLTPQTGDVLVLEHPREWLADKSLREEVVTFCQELHDNLEERGRKVVVVATPQGSNLRFLEADKISEAGWVRKSQIDLEFAALDNQLQGEPECALDTSSGYAAAEMIRRLKRENAALRAAQTTEQTHV